MLYFTTAVTDLNLGNMIYVSNASNSSNSSYKNSSISYDVPNGKAGDEGGKFIHGYPSINFQTIEVEVFQIV